MWLWKVLSLVVIGGGIWIYPIPFSNVSTHVYLEESMDYEKQECANQTINCSVMNDLFGGLDLEEANLDSNASLSSSLGASQLCDLDMNVDRFSYMSELGEGTYGKVWKAEDADIGRSVAVKSYKLTGSAGMQLLALETNIAGKINHPGIPTLYDIRKTEDGQCHYIMRFIEGESLQDIIELLRSGDKKTHDRFRFEQRVEIVIQILRVLSAAHKKKIIHRDIKPENIMIGPAGEAYLMDWGVALDLTICQGANQLGGSPRYMSPEQAQKKPLTSASDLYALTVVLYEFLSLKEHGPKYENIEDLLEKLPSYEPTMFELATGHPKFGAFPMVYASIIEKGLKINLEERYTTAEDMLHDLEAAQSGDIAVTCPITASFKIVSWLFHSLNVAPIQTFLGMGFVSLAAMATLIYIGTLL